MYVFAGMNARGLAVVWLRQPKKAKFQENLFKSFIYSTKTALTTKKAEHRWWSMRQDAIATCKNLADTMHPCSNCTTYLDRCFAHLTNKCIQCTQMIAIKTNRQGPSIRPAFFIAHGKPNNPVPTFPLIMCIRVAASLHQKICHS